jgi:hypothetical protein
MQHHCCRCSSNTSVTVIAAAKPVPEEAPPARSAQVPEEPVEKLPRRSFADITANPAFAHAPDYSWLVGELQRVRADGSWRLRYASVDEDDAYGGSVVLLGGSLEGRKEGQLVRVTGHFADSNARGANSVYLFTNMEKLPGLPDS